MVLAAYDESLSARGDVPTSGDEAIDPALLPELQKAEAFLWVLHQVWPSGDTSTPGPELGPIIVSETGAAWPAISVKPGQTSFGRFRIMRGLGQGGFGVVFQAWDSGDAPHGRAEGSPAGSVAVARGPQAVPPRGPGRRRGSTTPTSCRCSRWARWERSALSHRLIAKDRRWLSGWRDMRGRWTPAMPRVWSPRWPRPCSTPMTGASCTATSSRATSCSSPRILSKGRGLADLVPRVTDFSLAKIVDLEGDPTKSGVPIGSPPYMAPEQAEGRTRAIGPATDVYALGCILYEVLCGRTPFRGETALETLRQVLADDPPTPRVHRPGVPLVLESICLKCLEEAPVARYPDVRSLAEDLGRFLDGRPTVARPPGRWEKIRRKARRHPTALLVLTIVMACAAVLLAGGRWYEARLEGGSPPRPAKRRRSQDARVGEPTPSPVRERHPRGRTLDSLVSHAPCVLEILARHRPRAGEDDLREFTWYHLLRRCHTEKLTLLGHRGDVYYVEFSPRGDLLASAGKDGTVRIWDTTTWQQVRSITASRTEVNVAAFSPDGRTLATADDDGYLKLWEVATGHCEMEKLAHTGDAVIARFTPDGKTVMTGGRTDGLVRTWDRQTGSPCWTASTATGSSFRPMGAPSARWETKGR